MYVDIKGLTYQDMRHFVAVIRSRCAAAWYQVCRHFYYKLF